MCKNVTALQHRRFGRDRIVKGSSLDFVWSSPCGLAQNWQRIQGAGTWRDCGQLCGTAHQSLPSCCRRSFDSLRWAKVGDGVIIGHWQRSSSRPMHRTIVWTMLRTNVCLHAPCIVQTYVWTSDLGLPCASRVRAIFKCASCRGCPRPAVTIRTDAQPLTATTTGIEGRKGQSKGQRKKGQERTRSRPRLTWSGNHTKIAMLTMSVKHTCQLQLPNGFCRLGGKPTQATDVLVPTRTTSWCRCISGVGVNSLFFPFNTIPFTSFVAWKLSECAMCFDQCLEVNILPFLQTNDIDMNPYGFTACARWKAIRQVCSSSRIYL